MDLLRAAMVGAAGTPYQDGLFFFDLQLPPSYPAAPPQVCYRSFGLCVNPNLDESGTVCLSLLGTFDGEGPEVWSPANSSILQVVVSIQGLVLTAQPYYKRPAMRSCSARRRARATRSPTPRTPTSSRSGPCCTCCAARRRGSRRSSRATSAAAGGSCSGPARRTCGQGAPSARSTARHAPRRSGAASGGAPRGSRSRSPAPCRSSSRRSSTSAPRSASSSDSLPSLDLQPSS